VLEGWSGRRVFGLSKPFVRPDACLYGATENAGMENAGLENVGPNRMAGKGRTGKCGNIVCMGIAKHNIFNVHVVRGHV